MDEILSYTPRLKGELQAYLATKRAASPDDSWEADLLDRLKRYATTGKLLRGSLICYSYELFAEAPPPQAVYRAAVAIELTHSAMLIHDDIMDQDKLRRGKPALHYQYEQLAGKLGLSDTKQFGVNMGICGGDIALFLAFDLLSSLKVETSIQHSVLQLYISQLIQTCTGQMRDALLEASSSLPTKREIYQLMKDKTASYTVSLPLTMGAALAGQPTTTISQLRALGIAAGTIYQIRDDELGVLGDSQKLGKPIGSDIREGKKTLVLHYLMHAARTADRGRLLAAFGNPDLSDDDIKFVQQQIRTLGVPASLNQDIAKLKTKANAQVAALTVPPRRKLELEQLVNFCAKRQS